MSQQVIIPQIFASIRRAVRTYCALLLVARLRLDVTNRNPRPRAAGEAAMFDLWLGGRSLRHSGARTRTPGLIHIAALGD